MASVWIGLGPVDAAIDVSRIAKHCFGTRQLEQSERGTWLLTCETCGDMVQFFPDWEQGTVVVETEDFLSLTIKHEGHIRLLEAALLHRYPESGFMGFFSSSWLPIQPEV